MKCLRKKLQRKSSSWCTCCEWYLLATSMLQYIWLYLLAVGNVSSAADQPYKVQGKPQSCHHPQPDQASLATTSCHPDPSCAQQACWSGDARIHRYPFPDSAAPLSTSSSAACPSSLAAKASSDLPSSAGTRARSSGTLSGDVAAPTFCREASLPSRFVAAAAECRWTSSSCRP